MISQPGRERNRPAVIVPGSAGLQLGVGGHQPYEDGEWAIIQAMTKPVIPCLTKWEFVLHGMRNIEISKGFVQKYLHELDMTKRAFWEREERKSRQVEEEHEARERYAEDIAEKATKTVMKNPDLCERLVKHGLSELDLGSISRNIPGHRFRKPDKGVKNASSDSHMS